MPVTTITSKGQITIPAEFRKRDGFHPGERVSVREVDGQLIVEPVMAPVNRLRGMFADAAAGRPPATIEEWDEAIAAGWADEPIEPR